MPPLLSPPKTLPEFLAWIRRDMPGDVTAYRVFPERSPAWGTWPDLDSRLLGALERRGLGRPYSHQADMVRLALQDRDAVVVTPTASGKSLCYAVPILQRVLENPQSRALALFPTKALSQDQTTELRHLTEDLGVEVGVFTYDGDTPGDARRKVREAGHIVISNPDMLHTGILPHHTKWIRLFENLRYIVLDELHTYRGIFGSHLANVLRRLLRICAFYGSRPTFLGASATIRNPQELAERLLGRPVALVSENGAPAGEKHVLIYNPPVVDRALGIRRSSLLEAGRLTREALEQGIPTILFTRSRINVEVLLTTLRQDLVRRGLSPDLVAGYRGGYLPGERRAVEQGLREGRIRGVVTTNALELGVDIGSLQLAVLHGYPGSVAGTWQQMGRAGRRNALSAAVLVASSLPLDQYLATRSDHFFGASPEYARINPENLYILVNHVKCGAFELPFAQGDRFGGQNVEEILTFLAEAGTLHEAQGRYFWQAASYPAESVSLRSATSENFVILDVSDPGRSVVLGEVDRPSAPMLVHPEAIYFHNGEPYQVQELDHEGMRALVKRVEADYYTDADMASRLAVLDVLESAPPWGWGEVLLASRPTVYKKIRLRTHENVGYGHVHLPEEEMHTTALWLLLPEDEVPEADRGAVVAGLAHLFRSTAPLFLMCDRGDLRVSGLVKDPHFGVPAVYVVENIPGGVGGAESAFAQRELLWKSAGEALASCPCEEGCPGCIGVLGGWGTKRKIGDVLRRLKW